MKGPKRTAKRRLDARTVASCAGQVKHGSKSCGISDFIGFLWDSIGFHGIEWRKREISRGIQYSNYKCEKPRGWLSKVLRQPIQWHTHECREIHINNDVCRGYESKLRTLVPVRVRIKTSNSSFFVMHLHLPFVLRIWKSSPNGSRLDIGGIDQIRWIG